MTLLKFPFPSAKVVLQLYKKLPVKVVACKVTWKVTQDYWKWISAVAVPGMFHIHCCGTCCSCAALHWDWSTGFGISLSLIILSLVVFAAHFQHSSVAPYLKCEELCAIMLLSSCLIMSRQHSIGYEHCIDKKRHMMQVSYNGLGLVLYSLTTSQCH